MSGQPGVHPSGDAPFGNLLSDDAGILVDEDGVAAIRQIKRRRSITRYTPQHDSAQEDRDLNESKLEEIQGDPEELESFIERLGEALNVAVKKNDVIRLASLQRGAEDKLKGLLEQGAGKICLFFSLPSCLYGIFI